MDLKVSHQNALFYYILIQTFAVLVLETWQNGCPIDTKEIKCTSYFNVWNLNLISNVQTINLNEY